ncbi:MAG TPA: Ig-like domain-containing protein [Candidatus Ozemobacteraceae bacterium]|nr:Ig-like domain-containing protein [Candidatus Ozemobacteraceae bacterium]
MNHNTFPSVSSLNPVDGKMNVNTNANLVLTMSENVVAGTGVIEIWRTSGFGSPVIFESFTLPSPRVTIVGNTVTINPTNNLGVNRDYAVLIDGNCLRDTAGNYFAGYLTTTDWNFGTY